MDDISLEVMGLILFFLFMISAFFSSCETSMMTLNRYRLRHLVKEGSRSAIIVNKLLAKPARLLGLILFGNTLVNAAAASVTTVIGLKLFGETGIAIATMVLAVLILIFTEVVPKTIAALYPERIAFPASYILTVLDRIFYPVIWMINSAANGLMTMIGLNPEVNESLPLSRDELRTIVMEAGNLIPMRHQRMLISILDLENITVDEIMVQRNDINGIDINESTDEIIDQLSNYQHTRLPVYRDSIDNIIGILHVRQLPRILADTEEFSGEDLLAYTKEPYFVPLGTPLHIQLRNFQRQKIRMGLVVDEYGDIQGLVTLEDILEEIVGEFTTDIQTFNQDIHLQPDGTVMIDGTAMIRDINKQMHWDLPTDGPKTLNGLILETLETIPDPGTSLRIGRFTVEIMQIADNAVKTVRIIEQTLASDLETTG
jgi:Mg2+/Co2+ transporter CorB